MKKILLLFVAMLVFAGKPYAVEINDSIKHTNPSLEKDVVSSLINVNGSVDDLPTEILKVNAIGGWINSAATDESGKVYFQQSNTFYSSTVNGQFDINGSLELPDEPRHINYGNNRIICTYFGDFSKTITTFSTNDQSSFTTLTLSYLANGIDNAILVGDLLFISESGVPFGIEKIHICDWSSGPNGSIIGTYQAVGAKFPDFVVTGSTIYAIATVGSQRFLQKIDISDPANPTKTDELEIENATAVGVDDNYIYVGCKSQVGNDGLRILKRTGNLEIYKQEFLSLLDFDQILIDYPKMYVRDGKNVVVIDITNHDTGVAPAVLGQGTFDISNIEAISGNKLIYEYNGRLGTIDISDLSNMQVSTQFVSPLGIVHSDVDSDVIICIDYEGFIYAYNAEYSPGDAPLSVGNVPGAKKVFICSGECFVANDSKGIKIFKTNDLETEIGHYSSKAVATSNFIDMTFNSVAVYAVGGKNLEIFDRINDEAEGGTWPRKALAQIELEGEARSVKLKGNYLYVTHSAGISVFNIETPSSPNLLTTIEIGETINAAAEEGDVLIVCTTDANSTYLSAYDKSTLPLTLLKKQKIADMVAVSEQKHSIMEISGNVIYVAILKQLQSHVYVPESNEFVAGPVYNCNYNIKGMKIFNEGEKVVFGTKSAQPFLDQLNILLFFGSYGMLLLKAKFPPVLVGFYVVLYVYMLRIAILPPPSMTMSQAGDIKSGTLQEEQVDLVSIGKNIEGNLTINGEVVIDGERKVPIACADVKTIQIIDEGDGDNLIDTRDISTEVFPNLEIGEKSATEDPVATVTINCNAGSEHVYLSEIASVVRAFCGNDMVQGGAGNDDVEGGNDPDEINGAGGDDMLKGNEGKDIINGGEGNDAIEGGEGDDKIMGGEGDDVLKGDAGNDKLDGGSGKNDLDGGEGNDNLKGGNLNKFTGGSGNDKFCLNLNTDDIPAKSAASEDNTGTIINDEAGIDTLDLSSSTIGFSIDLDILNQEQTITTTGLHLELQGQIEVFTGSPENDTVYIDPIDVPRYLDGGAGNNVLIVDAKKEIPTDDGSVISVPGYQPISYVNFGEVIIRNVTSTEFIELGNETSLLRNYPNPFTEETTIEYIVPAENTGAAEISIRIYTVTGNQLSSLINKPRLPGKYTFQFDAASRLNPGVYFYRLLADKEIIATSKMIIR